MELFLEIKSFVINVFGKYLWGISFMPVTLLDAEYLYEVKILLSFHSLLCLCLFIIIVDDVTVTWCHMQIRLWYVMEVKYHVIELAHLGVVLTKACTPLTVVLAHVLPRCSHFYFSCGVT